MPVYFDKKKKTYFISISYTVSKGVYKKKTVRGFANKKDAIAYDSLLASKLQKNSSKVILNLIGNFSDGKNKENIIIDTDLKMSGLLEEWCIESKKANLSSNTYYNRKRVFNKSIIPFFKDKDVREVNSSEIIEWLDYLSSCKLSIPTIREYLSKFSQFYSFVNRKYNINYDPTKNVKAPKVRDAKKSEKVVWNWEQFQSFINVVDEPMYFTLFWLLWQTGLRIGELRGLKWYDYNAKKKELNIERQISDRTKKEDSLKSQNSYRTYSLDDYTVSYLNSLYIESSVHNDFSKNEYIFGDGHTPLSRFKIETKLNFYINAANKNRKRKLPSKFTPHCFRHSLVSILFSQGYTNIDIGNLIGDNPLTVSKTYAHFIPSVKAEMVSYYHQMNSEIVKNDISGF